MRRHLLLPLAALLLANPLAHAAQQPPTGAEAGAEAGRVAGSKAGAVAGQIAARQAVHGYTEPTRGECHALGVANRGLMGFFRKYDADKNWHLSRAEWGKALTQAVGDRYLPVDFSPGAEWEKVERNGSDEVSCREFVTYAKSVKALTDAQKEALMQRQNKEAAERAERARLIAGEKKPQA